MVSMSSIQFRSIHMDDIKAFHACLDAVARERKYLGFVQAPPLEATHEWLQGSIARGDIRLVAVAGARIVGWCDLEVFEREGFKHLGRLGTGVLAGYRRQGLGAALLEGVLAEARERGLERIELEVYASNGPAIALYEKYGFQHEGRKRRARKLDGEYDDILIMGLLLE